MASPLGAYRNQNMINLILEETHTGTSLHLSLASNSEVISYSHSRAYEIINLRPRNLILTKIKFPISGP